MNGETIFHVEYNRETNTHSVYNVDKEELLLLQYDPAGKSLYYTTYNPFSLCTM